MTDKRKVALVQGGSRRENIAAALETVSGQVNLTGVRRVLIKPNLLSTSDQSASTHVDALCAVLDFIRARYDGPVTVAEGSAVSPTWDGFRNFGYESLVEEYGVELLDLNTDDTVPVQIYDRRLRPLTAHLARTTVADGVYRISVGLPKTHDCIIVTLAIKNMVMGSLVNPKAIQRGGGIPGGTRLLAHLIPRFVWRSQLAEWAKGTLLGRLGGSSKMAMHQGFVAINLNLALVAARVWPHLAVIDGWKGMEGDGPGAGDPVDWRVALAGTDPLAVDTLTTHLMGFDPERVGYLQYCRQMDLGMGALDQIETLGNIVPEQRSFRPHPTYQRQLQWRLEGAERYLQSAV